MAEVRDPALLNDVPLRVVIAGGGVAALEAALALRALAGERVRLQILAPDPVFTYRPLEVREPFSGASAPRFDIAELAESIDAELIAGRLATVDTDAFEVVTDTGRVLAYDALVVALGAHPVRAIEHARPLMPGQLDDLLHGFIQDIEGGYIRSAAFVVPERIAWPLPLYELALMTAERAADMLASVDLTIVTSETAPLEIFGPAASATVLARLADAGITLYAASHAETPGNKQLTVTTDGVRRHLTVDSIVALPELDGPGVSGLPHDEHGFLPVDEYGAVTGVTGVFAAGDGTNGAIKQGGVAAQQAEVVSRVVAALAGAPVEIRPHVPELRGLLLTGGEPVVLGREIEAPRGTDGSTAPLRKIAAPRLAAYFAEHPAIAVGTAR